MSTREPDSNSEQNMERCAAQIRTGGIIAIVRGNFSPDVVLRIAESLLAGGVEIIEVTLNTSDALRALERLRQEHGARMLVGAGTVRTAQDVTRAHAAGAQFTIAPNFDPASVAQAQHLGMLHLPGIFTATEAQTAFAAGCSMVKLFPASLQGPAYLKALRAPLDDIEFVPTGGINSGNLAHYLQAGAAAVGVGSALIAAPDQDLTDITARAARLVRALQTARNSD